MQEHLHDYFTKEEEFLTNYDGLVLAASELLKNDWLPNRKCNDSSRRQRDTLLEAGHLLGLAFDAAAVYHNLHGFSSVQIILRSSQRIVNVRVARLDGQLVAEKLVDRRRRDE
jgi:hypothetical protein